MIPVKAVPAVPYVIDAGVPNNALQNWRISPASAQRPDPNQLVTASEMNLWGWGQPTAAKDSADKSLVFHLFRTSFTPRKNLANGNGQLHFPGISGKAEVWLDGKLIATKQTFATGELIVPLPADEGTRQINVIIENEAGQTAGLNGNVLIEPKK
jgi:beta-galactosidase